MRLMGHRLSKEIAVDLPDIRVLMGVAQFCFCVQRIELSASRKRPLLAVVDRLSAAADAAARAGHDFDKVVVDFPALDLLQQSSRISKAADCCGTQLNVADRKLRFLDSCVFLESFTADRTERVCRRVLAL